MPPVIEIIEINDTSRIKHLGYQTYLPHYAHLWHEGGMDWYLHKCFNESQLVEDLTNSALTYYTIQYKGQDVGLLKLVKGKKPTGFELSNALYLEKIYFLKDFTGLGLGQACIQWVCQQAVDWGFDSVWLMAMDSSHKAVASYEKAGFVQIATTHLDDEEFLRMKAEYRGMVVMSKGIIS